MYKLKFQEIELIEFEVTSGDAPMGCVLAVINIGPETKLLESHIEKHGENSIGGMRELTLTELHTVADLKGNSLSYSGGLISLVEELEEITIELLGIPYPEYEIKFPHIVKQYEEQFRGT